MDTTAAALQALELVEELHDRDHDCLDGGWVKPNRVYLGGQDVAPEWPCRTLAIVRAARGPVDARQDGVPSSDGCRSSVPNVSAWFPLGPDFDGPGVASSPRPIDADQSLPYDVRPQVSSAT